MSSIREQVIIHVPARTVWNALTTAEGVSTWWADAARIDPREGGRIVLERGEETERGIFLSLRPTRKIELAWDAGSPAVTKGSRVTFQLGRGDGGTKLHVVHSGGSFLSDEEAREAVAANWKAWLLTLRDSLEAAAS